MDIHVALCECTCICCAVYQPNKYRSTTKSEHVIVLPLTSQKRRSKEKRIGEVKIKKSMKTTHKFNFPFFKYSLGDVMYNCYNLTTQN